VNFKEYFKIDEGKVYDFQIGKEYVSAFIHAFSPGSTHYFFNGYKIDKLNDIIKYIKQNKNFGYNILIFRNTFKTAKRRHKNESIREVLVIAEMAEWDSRSVRRTKGKLSADQIFRKLNDEDFGIYSSGTYMDPKEKNQTFELVYKGTMYDLDKDTEQAWGGVINEL